MFEIDDLQTATLVRTSGVPDLVFRHDGSAGSFNGAASYVPQATASGLIFSEVSVPSSAIFFRIFASRRNP